jgi:hypothetical protein
VEERLGSDVRVGVLAGRHRDLRVNAPNRETNSYLLRLGQIKCYNNNLPGRLNDPESYYDLDSDTQKSYVLIVPWSIIIAQPALSAVAVTLHVSTMTFTGAGHRRPLTKIKARHTVNLAFSFLTLFLSP